MLPVAASLLVTPLLAWQLAGLVWALVPLPDAACWQPPPVAPAEPPTAQRAPADVERLIGARLFGEYQAPSAGRIEHAPDTRLALSLLGILAGDARTSRALIGRGGEEKAYAIGAEVLPGTTLHAIETDRVILARGGKYETLRLPTDADASAVRGRARRGAAQDAQPAPGESAAGEPAADDAGQTASPAPAVRERRAHGRVKPQKGARNR
ncbi:type II secretion system protein N [Fontimonas sp. SYSU GA230001]|uniref:type II secretion system protein N n=1 Tax=Fontimonas sp. SYSU GA230001 TaxID=3142450 RepID=UPI0032B5D24C